MQTVPFQSELVIHFIVIGRKAAFVTWENTQSIKKRMKTTPSCTSGNRWWCSLSRVFLPGTVGVGRCRPRRSDCGGGLPSAGALGAGLMPPGHCDENVFPLSQGVAEASPWHWMREVERQVASLSGQCQGRDERLRELTASLQQLQARVDHLDDGGAGVSSLVRSVVAQHLKDLGASGLLGSQVRPGVPHVAFLLGS